MTGRGVGRDWGLTQLLPTSDLFACCIDAEDYGEDLAPIVTGQGNLRRADPQGLGAVPVTAQAAALRWKSMASEFSPNSFPIILLSLCPC